MADLRFIVSYGPVDVPPTDRCSNTLYFSVDGSIPSPDYQTLANDIRDVYAARTWTTGTKIEVRCYDMADAKPRPEKAFATVTKAGTFGSTARQVAVCLSYYSERNLPKNRGRIYTGPHTATNPLVPSTLQADIIAFGQALAGIGGINVDWSVWSPTTAIQGGDPSKSITNIWVDNSWDVVRSRKLKATGRQSASVQ